MPPESDIEFERDCAEDLVALSDREFAGVVDTDIRGRSTPDVHAALRSARVIDRFIAHLEAMMRKTEADFAFRQAEINAAQLRASRDPLNQAALRQLDQLESDVAGWKPGAIRFQGLIARDLELAKGLLESQLAALQADLEDEALRSSWLAQELTALCGGTPDLWIQRADADWPHPPGNPA